MIRSDDEARLPVHSSLAGDGQHIWRYVHFSTNAPYFLVNYQLFSDDEWHSGTIIFWDIEDLLRFSAPTNNSKLTVTQVALISPAYMNRSSGWKISDIKEIWRGKKGAAGKTVTVYATCDGQSFTDDFEGSSGEELIEKDLVFEYIS